MLSVELDVQNPNQFESLPSESEMQTWSEAAVQLKSRERAFENTLSVLIRIVDSDESAELNQEFREKVGPTNVLSFPNDVSELMFDSDQIKSLDSEFEAQLKRQNSHLGDLVICEYLVKKEAQEQSKAVLTHWAHLIIHGVLHLQGFDHMDDDEALEMENLEIQIMEQLGFENPYTI